VVPESVLTGPFKMVRHSDGAQRAAWQDLVVAALADTVIDCRHPASLARFWAEVLDDYGIAPYDEDEIARLAALGITNVEDDPTVLVEAAVGPRLWFQAVPESKTVKNRLHLDLRANDRPSEVQRLVALGATVLDEPPGLDLTVLQDPEGNEFCVVE
jgi:hypothetical protein